MMDSHAHYVGLAVMPKFIYIYICLPSMRSNTVGTGTQNSSLVLCDHSLTGKFQDLPGSTTPSHVHVSKGNVKLVIILHSFDMFFCLLQAD